MSKIVKIFGILFVLMVVGSGCASGDDSKGIGGTVITVDTKDLVTTTTIAAPTTTTTEVPTTTTTVAMSSCDIAVEAALTGTPAEIEAAFRILKADKSAPVNARQTADTYLRYLGNDDMSDLREMSKSLVGSFCN